jgi:hypothetical protein
MKEIGWVNEQMMSGKDRRGRERERERERREERDQ